MTEDFKTIKQFPNYLINSEGIIRNTNTHHNSKEYIKWQYRKGYARVLLSYEGSSQSFDVHRLVAETHLPNPNNLPYVLHLDDNRGNPSLSNLKWGTQKENMEQSSKTGYYSTVKKTVTLISPNGEIVEVVGLRSFCNEQGLDWGNFQKVVKGKHNSVKGWKRLAINDC